MVQKIVAIICILTFLMISSICHAEVPAQDKVAHTITTFAIISTSYTLCRHHWKELSDNECIAMSYGAGIIAGLVKENVIDSKPDGWDYLANGVGVGLSIPFVKFEIK